MKKIMLKFLQTAEYREDEKSFVIAMLLIGIFNFSLVLYIINS